jgi:hypothetical protein
MTAPLADDDLQQYFDGELPEDKMGEIRAILDASPDVQARLDALSRLHDLVKLAAEAEADTIDSNVMFANVSLGVSTGHSMRVIHGGETQKRKPPRNAEFWKIAGPVSAVAIAAAILFAYLGPDLARTDPITDVRGIESEVTIEHDVSEPLVHVEPPHGTEVVEVDFGDRTGTVFAVEGDVGEPIAVVWISDETLDEVTQ